MKEKKELTAQKLALFLGCEVVFMGEKGYRLAGINTGQKNFNLVGLVEISADLPIWVKLDDIKPILRPLSDITEEEAREVSFMCGYNDAYLFDFRYAEIAQVTEIIGCPTGWTYLLSRHFDLFGWIESGLAIDKTKA